MQKEDTIWAINISKRGRGITHVISQSRVKASSLSGERDRRGAISPELLSLRRAPNQNLINLLPSERTQKNRPFTAKYIKSVALKRTHRSTTRDVQTVDYLYRQYIPIYTCFHYVFEWRASCVVFSSDKHEIKTHYCCNSIMS